MPRHNHCPQSATVTGTPVQLGDVVLIAGRRLVVRGLQYSPGGLRLRLDGGFVLAMRPGATRGLPRSRPQAGPA